MEGSPAGALVRLRRLIGWPIAVVAGFWLCASFIVLSGEERLSYYVNQYLPQPVFSRVSFEVVNQRATEEARKNAEQSVPSVFRLNAPLIESIQAEFRNLHAAVKAAENLEKCQETSGQRWPLDQAAFDAIKALSDEKGSEQFKRNVDAVADRLAHEDMIESAEVDREPRSTASKVTIIRGDGDHLIPKERLKYATNPEHVERLARDLVRFVFGSKLEDALAPIVTRAIVPPDGRPQPIYVFDRAATKTEIEAKLAALETVKDPYTPGDSLVPAGVLTAEGLSILMAEHEQYVRQRDALPELNSRWRQKQIGLIGLVFLVTVGLAVYTYRCHPRVGEKPTRALALAALLAGMLAADRFLLVSVQAPPMWSVATIAMTATVLTIAYSQVYAFGATMALVFLTVPTLGASYSLILVLMTVTSVAVLLLREVRTRLKMVEVGVVTAVAAGIGAVCVGLSHQQGWETVAGDFARAALAALGGISIVMVLLPVIEKAFRIATSLTLLEWADTSKPLLRQLIEKAPGTWQHSHLLGSMAERAADEIGANGLLVRVGAYYHDVGKICKPAYFVENQQAKMNAHSSLAPTMSLLVILSHVKDGLALAREHRLPPVLHQFIAEHHGTTIVRYFHARAAEKARADGRNDREVSESEFRYPGPRPRSRESAILMLCDSVEGAVRALQDPTPGRIENVVREVMMARLMDGQFDDCDITLKDLSRVEQSLIRSLCAIHHGRIAYPKAGESTAQVRTA